MGQYLATVRPRIDVTPATAYNAHDLLFDWHRFEIPEGEACIKSFNISSSIYSIVGVYRCWDYCF